MLYLSSSKHKAEVLEMSYDGRRVLRACKSKYRYTELFGLYRANLQAEEQMLD